MELLGEKGTTVVHRIPDVLPTSSSGWREELTAYARALRAEHLRHRDGARVLSDARVTDPEVAVRVRELLYRRWTEAGLTLLEADDAMDVIEERERLQPAAAGPMRYSLAERDAGLGEYAPPRTSPGTQPYRTTRLFSPSRLITPSAALAAASQPKSTNWSTDTGGH